MSIHAAVVRARALTRAHSTQQLVTNDSRCSFFYSNSLYGYSYLCMLISCIVFGQMVNRLFKVVT